MIKSDIMNRKILLFLLLLVLLSGCGQRRQPDVEHFQGEVVATLQKTVNQTTPEFLDNTPTLSDDPQPSPQTTQTIPTNTLVSTFTPRVSEPQSTNYPIGAESASVTLAPSATTNPDQTPTPTLGVPVWEGVWNIWFQNTRGGYTPAELTLQVSGTRLAGTAKIDGVDYSFSGDVLEQGSQVEGEWQTASNEGTFWWRMNSADTFVGSSEGRFGFCGNRTVVQPNPCREIPQD